jgi:thymidylate kinase
VEFRSLSSSESAQFTSLLRRVVGARHVALVEAWLQVGEPMAAVDGVRDAARRRFVRATLAPRPLLATWAQRAIVLPARRKGPTGMRSRGVTVALVGTDGSGKSTTAQRLAADLRAAGFTVEHQYFGMARGNLPGVGLIRRLAGGGDTTAAPSSSSASSATTSGSPSVMRQAASWVYVVDYWWRSVRRVRPSVRRGHVVICDRWVSDLRRHPTPDSPAARVAERLVGAPDVFVLADAPAEEMVARKPERTVEEAAAEQQALREVGGELAGRSVRHGGRCVFVTVDTSVATPIPAEQRIVPLVGAIVSAAHRVLPHDELSLKI